MTSRDDVEEFAALLRALKARTDRSYGSLARRLNMNTSTLHRYCAGEAVPQEFAPVERFAAFCEATAEERHELHRVWLSAVAARQRPKGQETGSAAGAPESSMGAEPSEPTAVAPPLEPAAGAAPVRPAPWFRQRRMLVGAGAAVVLLATIGSLKPLSSPPSDHPRSEAVGTPPSSAGRAPGTRSPGAKASASPTSSAASGGKKGSASPSSAPTGAERRTKASPDGDQGSAAVPLTWTADSQVWQQGCGHDYVIDKEPRQVPPPPVQQDAAGWAATQGAVHGRQTMVQISVQGKSSTAVVLEALRVRIAGRSTPLKGISYAMDQGCGGELTPRTFAVDLDVDRPIARSMPGADSEHTIPAVRFPYRVSATDPEVLLVRAETEQYDASWYLELDWSSQGRTGTTRIDDHGRPFRTTSIKGLPRYWYGSNESGRQWVPYDS